MGRVFVASNVTPSALRAWNNVPEVSRLRGVLQDGVAKSLGALSQSIGETYGSVFVRRDCAPKYGIMLLSQTDMFAAEPAGRIIRRDSMTHPDRHQVRRWQILIAGAGQSGEGNLFGHSIIADGRLAGHYIGPHAVAISFENAGGDANLYTYAFLNSSFGVRSLKSTIYGSSIPGLRQDLLAALPIPFPDAPTVARVAALIRTTVNERERYLTELRAARKVLEDLPEMREAHAMCADRKARCVAWDGELAVLTGWAAASTGGALGYLQRKWSGRLDAVLEPQGVYNGPRFARIPCAENHGISFMSQRDTFLIRPVPRRIAHPGFADRLLFVPQHGLLVGGHGTVGEGEIFGRVSLMGGLPAKTAFTQDVLRIIPTEKYAAVAYAYLSTLVGFRLLRSTAVGTKLLSMRLDLLRALPFPDLDDVLRARVDLHYTNAIHARRAADAAEREAIRIVEEEVLPAWLS